MIQTICAGLAALMLCSCPIAEERPAPVFKTFEAVTEVDEADVKILAKLVWGEARGVKSKAERAAVIWCALNRVDSTGYACGRDIEYVVTFPNQFTGYRKSNPVTKECYDLALDVLIRWRMEKTGEIDVGRVLPQDYLWFHGDGRRNHFRDAYRNGERWDWTLPDPYEGE